MPTISHMEPKASFVCITYRRPEFLNELLYCFEKQDWTGPKELIIINDEPLQKLVCDNPEVHIINWPRRLKPLGLKRNFAAAMASGDYLFQVDDDDLFLPHKISQSIRLASPMGIFKTDMIIVDTDPMELTRGRLPCNYMYTHRALLMASGYGLGPSIASDISMMDLLDAFMSHLGEQCGRAYVPDYIYRRFTTPWHESITPNRSFPADSEIPTGTIRVEARKPEIDIFNVKPLDNGRRTADVIRTAKADLELFSKGIKEKA